MYFALGVLTCIHACTANLFSHEAGNHPSGCYCPASLSRRHACMDALVTLLKRQVSGCPGCRPWCMPPLTYEQSTSAHD